MSDLDVFRKVGKQNLETAFRRLLKRLTGDDYQVELELVWKYGILVRISFLVRQKTKPQKS